MKLTDQLFSGRHIKDAMKKFNNYVYRFPYRQLLPPALRDTVSARGDRQKVQPCLQEMSQVLVCLKKHDFEQTRCSKEIEMFMTCRDQFEAQMGKVQATGKQYSRAEVVSQLHKYPQSTKKT